MLRYSLIFILGLTAVFGQKQTEQKGPANKGTPAVVIPADAQRVTPDVYKHTDSSGTKWIYRKTPFGIVKMKETVESDGEASGNPFGNGKSAAAKASAPIVRAVEEGESVRFERSTPFGPARWTRKKSELNADEREILERSRKSEKE